ncbi:tRNA (uridine(34)/cytosine(34)/5-carboxymethylaminomethyluridine(34)-2'-O)-methyltransferase TrmL [Aliidiomarina sedimenti]|uniref:tRNA (cytidine(34)-2'-O)-methyltransferase n=1 Tax=Aliidiomarina sedimenti TaxID=1933879 RepID=A0ABY0BY74_9GAMM|nr:tRNA (cytidine(34)-2'-O)-methyltransferase [Aliidiomarina sedimenti]RUO29220.1 tRNA (uridine(34)/cytosine(34)/5-carboxymethylaminomethyluridine(34)-2'-O)-methyltransferase TrmL [Aliidiomarina sedimenti]
MFHIALHNPVMPANCGNIIRLCANNGCSLHLIEPLGFDFEEKKLRRAGLDYHDLANVKRYPDFAAFSEAMQGRRMFACTTKGSRNYSDVAYQADDILLFGSETAGLPDEVREAFAPEMRIRIPMQATSRSLNLANSVSIISYEAWRQQGFAGAL